MPRREDPEITIRAFAMPSSTTKMTSLVGNSEVIFVVEDGIAKARPVSVHESFENLRRIEGQGIISGTNVVVRGVHYVSDGQPVTVTEVL